MINKFILLLSLILVSTGVANSEIKQLNYSATNLPSHVKNGIMKYEKAIDYWSKEYGVDKLLIIAIIWTESDFKHNKISHTNDHGLMQLNYKTKKWLMKKLNINRHIDAETNIQLGTYYLKLLYNRFKNWDKVIIAYNKGPNSKLTKTKYYYTIKMRYRRLSNGD